MIVKTKEKFQDYVKSVENTAGYQRPLAYGIGVRRHKDQTTLDVTFPIINYSENYGTAAVFKDVFEMQCGKNSWKTISRDKLFAAYEKFLAFHDDRANHSNVQLLDDLIEADEKQPYYGEREIIAFFLYEKDEPVADAVEGYFKLQCISQRKVLPHGLSLEGVFGKLNNIAWSNKGPILVQDVERERVKSLLSEPLVISHVDKFPYLINYHVPSGVRVVAGSGARLGGYLGEGTTIMPAGYVNFNAGTKGSAMVEGRVSAGVVVDKDTDIGGGASIMGTLSGGNKNVISLGKECLLGANSGTGISLGDGCTVAAGVYVTAGTKVSLYNNDRKPVDIDGNAVEEGQNVVKGIDLWEKPGLVFIQDSLTGKITARPNPNKIELNESLHKN